MSVKDEIRARMNPREEHDFSFPDYISDLLKLNMIVNPDAQGVARQIVAQGVEGLTEKQFYTIINKGLYPDLYVRFCKRCAHEIPWSEMLRALDDEFCSWCRKMEEDNN